MSLRPVWEYGSGGRDGVVEWVRAQGEGVGLEQFPFSAPIVPDRDLLARLVERVLTREKEVKEFLNVHAGEPYNSPRHDMAFEPRYTACNPTVGAACPYLAACHNPNVGADPIGSGLYVKRTPHHDVELEGEY
jgi:hypothetical protein